MFNFKKKIRQKLEDRINYLSDDIFELDGEELAAATEELEKLTKLRDLFVYHGSIKQFVLDAIKLSIPLITLGIAIAYDARGRTLPKAIDKYIPGPRL